MLAKLHVLLPFDLWLPDGAEFRLYAFEADGYHVQFGIPSRSGKPPSDESVTINGKPTFQADVLTITFKKETFDRTAAAPTRDPPEELVQSAIEYFVRRLRYVTQAPQIRIPEFPRCVWVLEYLNDDGSLLPEDPEKKLVRQRRGLKQSFSVVACDSDLWTYIFSLPPNFQPPAWHTLLLDSRAALPDVGSAVVLAATALEVFIGSLLDKLQKNVVVPSQLWDWINDRDNDHNKQPSVSEQFDALLEVMTNHSLKNETVLWQAFMNLKTARNQFVHEGVPRIGKGAPELSELDALALIAQAEAAVAKIREWIPAALQWPIYAPQTKIEVRAPIFRLQLGGEQFLATEEEGLSRADAPATEASPKP